MQDFVECVLEMEHDKIVGIKLLDKELKKDSLEAKTAILDIQVQLKDGTLT